jgi:hypothetical protein
MHDDRVAVNAGGVWYHVFGQLVEDVASEG